MMKNKLSKILKTSCFFMFCQSAMLSFSVQAQPIQKEQSITNIQLPATSTIVIDYSGERTAEQFPVYIESLKEFARQNGISDQTINVAFSQVYFLERVIKADKNQPEVKITFAQYLKNVVSPAKIKTAKEKYQQYKTQLQKASKLTHVPANYIVALWGIESGFGRNQGKEDIISALSTLSFEGRREAFFARELLAGLHILQEGHIEKSKFKGSWAGAMGQNQFMPSSYIAFGLDGDNDGIIDIWNNQADIFASTGNYLSTVGWNESEGWGNKVTVPKELPASLVGLDDAQAKTVLKWQDLGIKWQDKNQAHLKSTTKAWLIYAEKEDPTTAYLVSNNFRTIMHWNRSLYFAVSVGTLADAIVAPVKNDNQAQTQTTTKNTQKSN